MNGTLGGDPAVVVVQNYANGGLCTGSIIDDRAVLTAKHCVQEAFAEGPVSPNSMIVGIGDDARRLSRTLRVQSIHTTPGIYTEDSRGSVGRDLIGSDVAVLVLQSRAGVTPLPMMRESHAGLRGQIVTAVGFGQTPSGQVGVKYTASGRVTGTDSSLIYVGALTCQGDSGGPAITSAGEIAGVTSFGAGSCGSGYGAFQAIYPYLDSVIADALREAGTCVPDGAEVCDGRDNDCNDMVDETCTPIGGACTSDLECVGNTCRETEIGRVCTTPCDPLRPDFGCDAGMYCGRTDGCEGYCIPMMGAAALPFDADCSAHDQCASLYCGDPGDGRRRCLAPCRGDAGMCLAGEACAANPTECGGCVPAEILFADRGLGEACSTAAECRSGNCLEDAGRSYCTRDCSADSDCPEGYHCRDGELCVAGPRGDVGSPCVTNGDCGEGTFCVTAGERSWCTQTCDAESCPEGFECVDAGPAMVCAPDLALLGEVCATNDECVTNLCVTRAGSSLSECSQMCSADAPCAPGFECRRTADGATAVCVRPAAETDGGGGCSVSRSGERGPIGLWLVGLVAVGLVFLRRR
ncbi:MAG: trypsin-like serine protease [Sandaracinaceae bacterium]